LGLAACGSSGGSTAGPAASRPASPSTAAASPVAQRGAALFADMITAIRKARTARATFDSSVAGQQVRGSGSFRFGGDHAADVTVRLPGQGQVRFVLLPSAGYLRLPVGAGLPDAKPWLKIDDKGQDPASKAFGTLREQLRGSVDPGSNIGLLKAATTVKQAGRADIDGIPTTKYVASVDLAKAAKVADGRLAAQYRTLVSNGVTKLDLAVWVDGQSLLRRFATTVPTKTGAVTATGTYSDWGKPVSIKAPRAAAVATPGELGGLGSLGVS
jgi:hypothetical protein